MRILERELRVGFANRRVERVRADALRELGYIPQQPALYDELSVEELQRLLDSGPATPRRERKSPFKD